MPGPVFPIDNSSDEDGRNDWLASDSEVVERNGQKNHPGSKSKPNNNDVYYAKCLRDKDAQLNEKDAQMKTLRREMARMMTDQKKQTRSKKGQGSTSCKSDEEEGSDTIDHNPEQDIDTADKDGEMKRLRQLGGKFAIMYMLWLGNTRAAFRTKPDPEYTPMDRFNGDVKWKRQGEFADLLEVLPEEYHNKFTGNIYSIFDDGMNAERSNSASRIRLRLGPRIFEAPPDQFLNPDWRYDNYRELASWTENANRQAYYNPFAPILYRNYQGRPEIENVFLNQVLFKIFNVIIRGPSALDKTEPGHNGGKPTQDRIWGLTEITPRAIAASAIYARYAISKDIMLQRQGTMTNIDYEADFNMYLRYLTSGLTNKKRSITKIFDTWNQFFFPSTTKSNITTASAPDRVIDAVFAALDDERDSDGDPPDHTSVPQSPSPTRSTISHNSESSHVVCASVAESQVQCRGGGDVLAAGGSRRQSISELETNSSLTTTTTITKTRQPRRAPPALLTAEPNRRSLRSRAHAPAAVNNAVADHQDDEQSANAAGKGKGPGPRKGKKKA